MIKASGAVIEHEGSRAFFNISQDKIRLPVKDKFYSAGQYYATALHELIHWLEILKEDKGAIFTAAAAAAKACDYLLALKCDL